MFKLFIKSIIFFILLLTPSSAEVSLEWEVRQISGTAWLLEEATQAKLPLKKHTKIHPGQTLKTGDRTRVLLARNKERLQVGSNAIISIPAAKTNKKDKSNTTIIKLRAGKVDLIVKKMPQRHFTVNTPFITAVVKGTRFSVSTTDQRSAVRVFEGLVGVTSHLSKETVDIRPGKSAILTSSDSREAPPRFLLVDNPRQATLFKEFPEVYKELSIPNPNISSGKLNDNDSKTNQNPPLFSTGGFSGIIAFLLSTIGTAFSAVGSVLNSTFSSILTPILELAEGDNGTIAPTNLLLLIISVFIAIIGLIAGGLIIQSKRKQHIKLPGHLQQKHKSSRH